MYLLNLLNLYRYVLSYVAIYIYTMTFKAFPIVHA